MAEKVKLSTFWQDPEGWAGTAGDLHKPGDTVTLENAAHAALLREAGYEATDAAAKASK